MHSLFEDVEVVLFESLQVELGLDERQEGSEGFRRQHSLQFLGSEETLPRVCCYFEHNIKQPTLAGRITLSGVCREHDPKDSSPIHCTSG